MNADLSKKIKQPKVVIVAVAVLGIIVGATGSYFYFGDADEIVASKQSSIPSANSPVQPKSDKAPPEGTVSPSAIAAKPMEYNGKELNVFGNIVKAAGDRYILVSTGESKPAAINLNLSENKIDGSAYVSGYENTKDLTAGEAENAARKIGPITASGVLKVDEKVLLLQ